MCRLVLSLIMVLTISPAALFGQDAASEAESEVPAGPQTLEELDRAVFQQRLIEIYGEKRYTDRSVWEVSRDGVTEEWIWNGANFEGCESTEDFQCANWTPTSFQWFMTRNNWLEGWQSMQKQEFYLGEEKSKPRVISAYSVLGAFLTEELARENSPAAAALAEEVAPDEEAADEDDEIRVGGKRLASEVWIWERPGFPPFKVYSSLRNQWIERIDHNARREIIEWKPGPRRWSRPKIDRVLLEQDGKRITLKRSDKKAPK